MKKKPREKTNLEIIQSIRNDWGNVKPYTRIEESKKHKKPKHKRKDTDYEETY